jgi:tetraprenyl-beta-curcumene synthase
VTKAVDPAPLTPSQLGALLAGAARQLIWGLRAVRVEHRSWVRHAEAIADPGLRGDALAALADKRPLLDGAALFWTLPDRRNPDLLRLLVAFQVLANYHDRAGERVGGFVERADPAQTMRHFAESIDLSRAPRHYQPTDRHPDGGFLAELVGACRAGCRRLALYDAARPHLITAARQARSLELEHVADASLRPRMLRAFAKDAFDERADLEWFELAAGSSSLLTAIVVLALAAAPDSTTADLATAADAYIVVATVSALLDNYVDYEDDRVSGSHNYLNYYGSFAAGIARLADLLRLTMRRVGRLRHGDRHRVIVAAMIAMYLTSDGARTKDPWHTATLADAGGRLTTTLLPVLAAWRKTSHERGA